MTAKQDGQKTTAKRDARKLPANPNDPRGTAVPDAQSVMAEADAGK